MGQERLEERVRPRSLDQVVGQSEAIRDLVQWRAPDGTWGGRALLFTGPSGSGKTTMARIVAAATAKDPMCRWELNAGRVKIETLEEIAHSVRHRNLYGGYAVVLNEVHGLRTDIRRELLTMLDAGSEDGLKPWVVWCLTTTQANFQRSFFDSTKKKGEVETDDPLAFLSRCDKIVLRDPRTCELEHAIHLRNVAREEGKDGRELDAYMSLLRRNEWNIRACLSEIEAGKMRREAA